MQKTITKTIILLVVLTLALGVNYLFAAWTGPTQAPTGGNTSTPVHVGTTDQVKNGGLSLDGLSVFGGGYFQGNVGVGVVTPSEELDVSGDIKASGTICDSNGCISGDGSGFYGSPTRVRLANSITSYSVGTLYSLLSTNVTMPSSGGPFRILVSYAYLGDSLGSNSYVNSYVDDGLGSKIASGFTYAEAGPGWNHVSEISSNTYSDGQTVTLTLKLKGLAYIAGSSGWPSLQLIDPTWMTIQIIKVQ